MFELESSISENIRKYKLLLHVSNCHNNIIHVITPWKYNAEIIHLKQRLIVLVRQG